MDFLLTCFCFDPRALSGKHIAELIRSGAGFEPTEVRIDGRKRLRYQPSVLASIEASGHPSDVRLQTEAGPAGPYFQVIELGTWRFQAAYWRVSRTDAPSQETLDQLTGTVGFTVGYRCAADDVFWQSETNVQTYELYGKPHRGLRKVSDPAFGGSKIDISMNPGRRTPYPGMWLQAAWQMWFGPGAFDRLPVTRIRDFKNALRMRTLKTGVVCVQLYDDPFAFDVVANRKVQAAFRQWSGMNELEQRAAEAGAREADPSFEIRQGAFPHGGVRLMTEWRDGSGHPAPRSRASERLDVELDGSGQEVWRETQRLH